MLFLAGTWIIWYLIQHRHKYLKCCNALKTMKFILTLSYPWKHLKPNIIPHKYLCIWSSMYKSICSKFVGIFTLKSLPLKSDIVNVWLHRKLCIKSPINVNSRIHLLDQADCSAEWPTACLPASQFRNIVEKHLKEDKNNHKPPNHRGLATAVCWSLKPSEVKEVFRYSNICLFVRLLVSVSDVARTPTCLYHEGSNNDLSRTSFMLQTNRRYMYVFNGKKRTMHLNINCNVHIYAFQRHKFMYVCMYWLFAP